jgi:hypothetical protein
MQIFISSLVDDRRKFEFVDLDLWEFTFIPIQIENRKIS